MYCPQAVTENNVNTTRMWHYKCCHVTKKVNDYQKRCLFSWPMHMSGSFH